eukprot:GFUD01034207.1.p1 GENE.GFUD01034207.1~~GFUD01034207.1.p1  ORF type:complete len:166 (-),score=43.97 GFUD01034207.1:184-681(-)
MCVPTQPYHTTHTLICSLTCSTMSLSTMSLSTYPLLVSLLAAHLALCSSYSVNIAVSVEEGNIGNIGYIGNRDPGLRASSVLAISPDKTSLVESLADDLEKSYKNLTHCGFSKILKCTEKITEAIAKCTNHPDITQCIEEILGANSECKDCIKVICRKLHIHACQ